MNRPKKREENGVVGPSFNKSTSRCVCVGVSLSRLLVPGSLVFLGRKILFYSLPSPQPLPPPTSLQNPLSPCNPPNRPCPIHSPLHHPLKPLSFLASPLIRDQKRRVMSSPDFQVSGFRKSGLFCSYGVNRHLRMVI